MASSPGVSVELGLFNRDLRGLTPDEIAASVAAGVKRWREGFTV